MKVIQKHSSLWRTGCYTPCVKKGCHPNRGYNFVNSWSICKIFHCCKQQ